MFVSCFFHCACFLDCHNLNIASVCLSVEKGSCMDTKLMPCKPFKPRSRELCAPQRCLVLLAHPFWYCSICLPLVSCEFSYYEGMFDKQDWSGNTRLTQWWHLCATHLARSGTRERAQTWFARAEGVVVLVPSFTFAQVHRLLQRRTPLPCRESPGAFARGARWDKSAGEVRWGADDAQNGQWANVCTSTK